MRVCVYGCVCVCEGEGCVGGCGGGVGCVWGGGCGVWVCAWVYFFFTMYSFLI